MIESIRIWFFGLPTLVKTMFWIFILLDLMKLFLKSIFKHRDFTLAGVFITLYILIMIMLVKSLGILTNDVFIL